MPGKRGAARASGSLTASIGVPHRRRRRACEFGDEFGEEGGKVYIDQRPLVPVCGWNRD